MQPSRRQPMSQQQARPGSAVGPGQNIQHSAPPRSVNPLVPAIPGEQLHVQQNMDPPRTSSTQENSTRVSDPNRTESIPEDDDQENIPSTESIEVLQDDNQENMPPPQFNMGNHNTGSNRGHQSDRPVSESEHWRMVQAYRLAKYLAGDMHGYQRRPAFEEVAHLRLPHNGRWPGLNLRREKSKWEVVTRDPLPPHANMIIPPIVQGRNARGSPINVRNNNARAMTWTKDPSIKARRSINRAARFLHPAGLRFRRLLGQGGFGVAALFEAAMPVNPQVTLQFAAKALLDPKQDKDENGFAEEKKMLHLLEGAQHIVQPMTMNLLQNPSAPRSHRITAHTLSQMGKDNSIVLTEYMSMGSLLGLLGRLTKINHYMPNRALWHLLSCVIHACMALKMPPGNYKPTWNKRRTEERKKARAEKKPAPSVLTEKVPPEDGLTRGKTIVHFDIDPQNILMESNAEGHRLPIFKLNDFGLADFAYDGDNYNTESLHRYRTRAKDGFLAPEQFTEEWDYQSIDPFTDNLGDDSVAGNYDSTTNIWQMGLVMQSAIVREWPLCPPIAQLCEVYPEGIILLADAAVDPEDYILQRIGVDDPDDAGNEGHRNRPRYNAETNSGFLWTYATQLLLDREVRRRTEPRLIYCVCRMLAHRPADRISLSELNEIVDQMLEEVPQGRLDDDNIEQGRDQDFYDDQYLQIWINMLYSGIPEFNVMLEEEHEDKPYQTESDNVDDVEAEFLAGFQDES